MPPSNPPDDDFYAKFEAKLRAEDFDDDPEFDEQLRAEFERLVPDDLELLPEDLGELFGEIEHARLMRIFCDPPPPPYVFKHYEAWSASVGGMGMVIEARDPVLDRKVAIKFWKKSGPEARIALVREAQTLAKLTHPNVITVYNTGRWQERVYFIMEWVEGQNGEAWLETLRPWTQVREVFVAAGKGLAAAHDAGIQHRDFKPSNILIGNDGRTLVADFGVADRLRSIDSIDEEGVPLAGTRVYMAPERLRGGHGDARSDQFSFCVAMWEALHAVRPYAGGSNEELLESIENGRIRVSGRTQGVPPWISRVVRKGLAEDPELRHRDMYALLDALTNEPPVNSGAEGDLPVLEGSKGGAGVLHAPQSGSTPARFGWHPFVYGLLTATALLLSGIALWNSQPPQRVPDERPVTSEVSAATQTPYQEIISLVKDDKFEEAEGQWYANVSELRGDESLAIGLACLTRARKLKHISKTKSESAATLAYTIAAYTKVFSADPEVREAGSRLEQAVDALAGRPPAPGDNVDGQSKQSTVPSTF